MFFYPIFLPNTTNDALSGYVLPTWVEWIALGGFTLLVFGVVGFLVSMLLEYRWEYSDKAVRFFLGMSTTGGVLLILALWLAVITAEKI